MSSRFEVALKNTEPSSHWQQFEQLSSQFLVDDFPGLRTLAAPTGDGGRDATLRHPDGDENIAIQYSTSARWEDKIRSTVSRLNTTNPQVSVLIYMTPLKIGADADALVSRILRKSSIYVDIHDRNWFVEREMRSATTQKAAEWYIDYVIGDFLQDSGPLSRPRTILTTDEARAALVYLVLQRQDDELNRHLTKQSFDALVRAVLRGTDSDNRMRRADVHAAVASVVPTHQPNEIAEYVDLALDRLGKKYIRHWKKQDEFCLTFEERERLAEGIARLYLLDGEFESDLMEDAHLVADGLEIDISIVDRTDLLRRLRRVLERFLFERGETFVKSLDSGQNMMFVEEELETLIERDLNAHPDTSSLRGSIVPLVSNTIQRTLVTPSAVVRAYLRSISEAYTLYAFLRESPNVQSAVTKLFSQGDIWLDTSALLPVLAEELLDPVERSSTRLLQEVRTAGAHLYVTTGVLEEIDAHLAMCLVAAKSPGTWRSRTPFLLASALWTGFELAEFPIWIERFRGHQRPLDDISEYLDEVHGIQLVDLTEDYESADEMLRWQTRVYWEEVHEHRRDPMPDPEVLRQLVLHDAENYLGVLQRRRREQPGNPFGYTTWWLTLDGAAIRAAPQIAEACGLESLDSPVLSYDFLTYYLAVGPARRQLEKSSEEQLPLLMDSSFLNALPSDLLAAADTVRVKMKDQPDRVVRRQIRDQLDREKLRDSTVGKTTVESLEEDIRRALESRAPR